MELQSAPKIGEIYMMEFEGSDHEQSGKRPGIVLQNNIGNQFSPNVIAIPLTSCLKKQNMPSHVVIRAEDSDLKKDSMALCENPVCISKSRLGFYISTLDTKYMKLIARAVTLSMAAVSFLSVEELIDTWHASVKLNA